MSVGFNSDVTVGDDVCHVQTEDHGHPQCRIETLVYHRGRILHRRNSSYSDLAGAPDYSDSVRGERVENQHRSVIDELRRGAISIPAAQPAADVAVSPGIQVRLRNANSWLVKGQAALDVEVLQRADNQPVREAHIQAYLSGAKENARFEAKTGPDGLAQLRFAVPRDASHGAELIIRANTSASEVVDEIRFVLRAKPRSKATEKKS